MAAPAEDVWEALLDNYDRALRVAHRRCGSRDEVQDCVQEAIARVAGMKVVDVERAGPLLSTVVSNLAVDGYRRRTRDAEIASRIGLQSTVEPAHEETFCDAEEARWLWSRRLLLTEQDRTVLEMRVAGHSISESAALLGISYKAAENALGRARSKLRTLWRATAALIALLWGLGRRPGAATVVVPVLVAVAAGLALPGPRGGDAPVPFASVPSDTLRQHNLAAATAPTAPTSDVRPSAVGRPASDARPTARATPPARAVSRTRPVNGGAVQIGEAGIDRRHEDETFQQTLERCVQRGIVVRPDRVECRESPSAED